MICGTPELQYLSLIYIQSAFRGFNQFVSLTEKLILILNGIDHSYKQLVLSVIPGTAENINDHVGNHDI
jgi:hypothetical protein